MIRFNVVPRKSPIDHTFKYYAQEVPQQQVDFDQLCDEIAHSSTATAADASAVIKEMLVHITAHLLDGRSVSLGDMGSLHTTLQSEGVKDRSKFTAAQIKKCMIRWVRPTKLRREFTPGVGSVRFKQESEKTVEQAGDEGGE